MTLSSLIRFTFSINLNLNAYEIQEQFQSFENESLTIIIGHRSGDLIGQQAAVRLVASRCQEHSVTLLQAGPVN